MKYLLFLMLLSVGCSAVDEKDGSDTGRDLTKSDDMGMGSDQGNDPKTDLGKQDLDVGSDLGDDDASFDLQLPDCVPTDLSTSIKHDILIGKNLQKEISFTIALCQEDVGRGESSLYRIDHFSVTWKNKIYDIGIGDLKYNNTHHNWFDSLVARSDTADFDWELKFESDIEPAKFVHTLSGKIGSQILPQTIMDVECENCTDGEFVLKN